MRALAESLRADLERMTEQAPTIVARAREVEVTRESPDGMVQVTVDAQGGLIGLDIDPRVYRRPDAVALADAILDAVQLASVEAREQVVTLFEPIVPAHQMRMHLDGDLDGVLEHMAQQMLGKR